LPAVEAAARRAGAHEFVVDLDDGEIVERGTHEDLLDVDGLYANLWRVQVGEVDALPEEFLDRAAHGEVSNPSE
jgi:hypothetical protein